MRCVTLGTYRSVGRVALSKSASLVAPDRPTLMFCLMRRLPPRTEQDQTQLAAICQSAASTTWMASVCDWILLHDSAEAIIVAQCGNLLAEAVSIGSLAFGAAVPHGQRSSHHHPKWAAPSHQDQAGWPQWKPRRSIEAYPVAPTYPLAQLATNAATRREILCSSEWASFLRWVPVSDLVADQTEPCAPASPESPSGAQTNNGGRSSGGAPQWSVSSRSSARARRKEKRHCRFRIARKRCKWLVSGCVYCQHFRSLA